MGPSLAALDVVCKTLRWLATRAAYEWATDSDHDGPALEPALDSAEAEIQASLDLSQPVDPHADSRALIADFQARIAELEHYESEVTPGGARGARAKQGGPCKVLVGKGTRSGDPKRLSGPRTTYSVRERLPKSFRDSVSLSWLALLYECPRKKIDALLTIAT